MKTYAFDLTKNTIKIFPSRKDAISSGNGMILATDAEDLASSRLMLAEMVTLYNHFTPAAPIKKFSDRGTAVKRLIALADAHGKVVECEPRHEPEVLAAAPKQEKAQAKKAAPEGTKRGRVSEFAGKVITSKVEENPRREGTQGFESFKIVLANPGLTYEAYLAAGGRRQDLAWDLANDWVVVS